MAFFLLSHQNARFPKGSVLKYYKKNNLTCYIGNVIYQESSFEWTLTFQYFQIYVLRIILKISNCIYRFKRKYFRYFQTYVTDQSVGFQLYRIPPAKFISRTWESRNKMWSKNEHCFLRAPLLLLRSWVALSFKVCLLLCLLGIPDPWPNLHFFRYIKSYMP